MAVQSRASKYLLLQVWCGILTLAMVVMAAVLTSLKLSSTDKNDVSTHKPENVLPTANPFVAPSSLKGSSFSHIQLTKVLDGQSWQIDTDVPQCDSCALVLRNNSIHCTKSSVYFFYAHVTFKTTKETAGPQKMTVTFNKDGGLRRDRIRPLFEGIYSERDGSVFVAKTVSLREGESVSLVIKGTCRDDVRNTYWGAYQLH